MKTLGLDIGDKTIGVAVSDDLGITAQGVTTLFRKSLTKDQNEIFRLLKECGAQQIVYGLPLNMNGSEGPQVTKVRNFIKSMSKVLDPSISVIPWDERLSTSGAERSLLEADLSRAKRKKVINKMAAVFILQGYMDSVSNHGDFK